jgi:hypothetical protein
MTRLRYLNVTTTLSDQKTSDSTPRTFSRVAGTPYVPVKHSFRA